MNSSIKLTFIASAIVLGVAVMATSAPPAFAADGTAGGRGISSLVAKTQDGGVVEIRMALSVPLTQAPSVFSMSNPYRVVFDVPGTANLTGQRVHEVAQGDVQSLNLIQAQGVTRAIVNLKSAMLPKLDIQGNELVLTLTKQVAGEVRHFAERTTAGNVMSGVDFRVGPSGEGRVVVDLSNPEMGIDIRQKGSALEVDFSNASIAEQLLKRMNVTDFGTPVKNVTLTKIGSGVRMLIEPQGLWEYNAYQTDSRFVMEVRPVKYDANKLVQGSAGGYKGEKMSLNFQNVDIRNLINVIADFTKMNIVTSDNVQGTMTIRLQDIPWDQALDIVLQSRGLDMRKNGNVIWIAPADEIAKREKDRLINENANISLEPLRSQNFQLNYSNSSDVIKLLTNKDQRLLSERGSVVADERTNQIFVQDNSTKLADIAKIISKIDVPVRQVMIEARIVEANDKFSRALGARLGFVQTTSSSLLGGPSRALYGSSINSAGAAPNFLNSGSNVNLPSPSLDSGASAGSFAISLFNGAATRFLNLELTALEADGRGKIVSSPSVVTADKEKAIIEQGTELPYLEASSSGAATVSFKKANLKLEVLPQITPDGNVIMSVDINKDAPGSFTTSGIAIDTKHVKTKVLIENGGTVVIGGIFTQDERTDVSKIPFLGDLPAIGNLFKNTVKKDNKTELIIFLTPKILDTGVSANVPR